MSAAPLYPPPPAQVPADLTVPPARYRAQVIIVLVSLILFVLLYLGLIVGSAYLCYWSFAAMGSDTPRNRHSDSQGWYIVPGVCSAVLFLFLLKGLFKRPSTDGLIRVEIKPEDQPELFAFIRQVCADTRAPRPHRVFLTPDVNAAVVYHSSFLSLFLPTPKNLILGLGLVNRLTLSEFKAVLAHEFGHFSQNSMKLGTYVYVSNRIIADIVYGRDWLDDIVAVLRRSDIRIALFAWIFTGMLWGLRKLLEGIFRLINFANSALSRQMEFNADLVAVSVTGSDPLIFALARLNFANEALLQASTISAPRPIISSIAGTSSITRHGLPIISGPCARIRAWANRRRCPTIRANRSRSFSPAIPACRSCGRRTPRTTTAS